MSIRSVTWSLFCLPSLVVAMASVANAQLPTGWRAHDWDRAEATVVTPGDAALPVPPPSDAVVLFDGKDLSQWCDNEGNPAKWIVKDDVMESVPGSGYVFTKQAFGDCQLHVEWSAPQKVEGSSQGRGNSGVFLMGLYEVQVLDSFENRTYADGHAASVYGQYPPLVNASRKPGEWQSYDIIFHRARFTADGDLLSPARLTVLHNQVLVQDNVESLGPTSWLQHYQYSNTPEQLPLSLQDHGNPVRYRNIWIRTLKENPRPLPTTPYRTDVIQLASSELDGYVGEYGNVRIGREGRHLTLNMGGRPMELIAHTPTDFSVRYTAITLQFEHDKDGKPVALDFMMAGDTSRMERKVDEPAAEIEQEEGMEEEDMEVGEDVEDEEDMDEDDEDDDMDDENNATR